MTESKNRPTPKEARPDGQWILDREKDILCITRTKKGNDYEGHPDEREYEKAEDSSWTDITIGISDKDAKVVVEPYHLQVFERQEESQQTPGYKNKLIVAIKDGKKIHYIGFLEDGGVNQFFFDNDRPADYTCGHAYVWAWPEARSQMVDNRTRSKFAALVEMVPGVSQSLEKCLDQLAVPGPEYGNPHMAGSLPLYRTPPNR